MPVQCTCRRPGCGVTFIQKPNTAGFYCSVACSALMRQTLVDVACEGCGKSFKAKPSKLARGFDRWCSRECSDVRDQGYTEEQFWAAFWQKTRREGDCLIWTGKQELTLHGNYGLVWVGPRQTRKRRRTHQVSLEQKLGRPIAKGLQTNHTCDRMLCVNPDHLYEGTQQQNMDDMYARGRGKKARGDRSGRSKVTEAQIREIRIKLADGVAQMILAIEYGVSPQTISAIKTNVRRQGIGVE